MSNENEMETTAHIIHFNVFESSFMGCCLVGKCFLFLTMEVFKNPYSVCTAQQLENHDRYMKCMTFAQLKTSMHIK